MADEVPDSSAGAWWHKVIAVGALGLASSVGGAITSHFGAPTNADLKAVKDDIAAMAAKQQSDDGVNATNHAETKAQIAAVSVKVDKLSAAVLAPKKKKRSNVDQ
jgi:hypothetical protein